ncbi:hypothetical protein [Paenibacillus pabuli]|uniref:hypothetical protein n=1 Tax=Paenibacillus pabuli TaxID=1472 RepID=UPI001430D77C|nr:hypothetical protein [Paenibacillus pabuli]MEC0128242.1 hypothetical protein [Paenibacillus pabuli]
MLWMVSLPRSGLRTAQTPHWERQDVSLVSAAGIIEVRVWDHFMPGDTTTWANVATVLLRMLNLRELNRI